MPQVRDPLASPAAQSNSRLVSLPAELRNRIYEAVLGGDIVNIPWKSEENPEGLLKSQALLVTCKQVYKDAILMYYATSIFQHVACSDRGRYGENAWLRLAQWLKTIGSQNAALLTCIRVSEVSSWSSNANTPSDVVFYELCEATEALRRAKGMLSLLRSPTLGADVLKWNMSTLGGAQKWHDLYTGREHKAVLPASTGSVWTSDPCEVYCNWWSAWRPVRFARCNHTSELS